MSGPAERAELLTTDERRAVELLADLSRLFGRIVGDGSTRQDDLYELTASIHVLQNAVLAQSAARAYPELYRLLGGTVQPGTATS